MKEREALRALVAAIDYRNAVLISGEMAKSDFAHQKMWEALDNAKEVLDMLTPASRNDRQVELLKLAMRDEMKEQ